MNNANLLIADISGVPSGESPILIAQGTWSNQYPAPRTNIGLHSMTPTPDGTETHLAYLSGFFLILDTTDVAEGNYGPGEILDLNDDLLTPVENRPTWDNPNPGHSAVPFPGRPFSFTPTRSTAPSPTRLRLPCWLGRAIQGNRRSRVIGEYKIPENPVHRRVRPTRNGSYPHNPTLTRNLAPSPGTPVASRSSTSRTPARCNRPVVLPRSRWRRWPTRTRAVDGHEQGRDVELPDRQGR